MSEKKRRVFSLVILALFITIVGFANNANAGGPTGPNSGEIILQNAIYSAYSNR